MTPELWDRLKPLFEAAVEKPSADRRAFIEPFQLRANFAANCRTWWMPLRPAVPRLMLRLQVCGPWSPPGFRR